MTSSELIKIIVAKENDRLDANISDPLESLVQVGISFDEDSWIVWLQRTLPSTNDCDEEEEEEEDLDDEITSTYNELIDSWHISEGDTLLEALKNLNQKIEEAK